ncbi:MAG: hypothetical protein IJW18_06695 [Lachnospiraceae bacterium]|nr:hypothetical protein [Lachnospiraceae bacterium]
MIHKEDFKEALRNIISYEFENVYEDTEPHLFSTAFETHMQQLINYINEHKHHSKQKR